MTAYFGQSIGGEFDLLRRARPIDQLAADGGTAPELRSRLATVSTIRNFASRELLLPDNGSYRRYADLERSYAVWNVFAAPELSLRLSEWCFPIAGCVSYRGYFSERAAYAYADALRRQGLDVYVAGVPAFSTLGYFDDPVLNTFIRYPEAEIARLLFHELAHQVAYAPGDTVFNESFATAVERIGMRRYLRHAAPGVAADDERKSSRRDRLMQLVDAARLRLESAYRAAGDDGARRAAKARIVGELRGDYAALRQGEWAGFDGYDLWFAADLNNAKLASMAAYGARVADFESLLGDCGGELAPFYAEAKRLAKLPRGKRDAALDARAGAGPRCGLQAASE